MQRGAEQNDHAMRAMPTLLLIFALLVCPYHCSASLGLGCAGEEVTSGCRCCQHHKPKSDMETDQCSQESPPQSSDCQCGSCLCHGAVRGDEGSTQDLLASTFAMADAPAMVVVPVVINLSGKWIVRPPIPAPAAGRTLCLALHSLQI